MKRMKTWRQIFIVIGTISAILLFINWLVPPEGTWMEMKFVRLCYFVVSLVFFVSAFILDIVKGAVGEERNK